MKTYDEYIANLCKDFDNFIPTKEQYEKILTMREKRHQDFLLHQEELRIQNEKYDKAQKGCYGCIYFHRGDHMGNPDSGDVCLRGEKDRFYCQLNPHKLDF